MSKLVYYVSKISDGNMSYSYGQEAEVTSNRRKFLDKNNIRLEECVTTFLQNSDQVKIVSETDCGSMFKVDALITTQTGVGLFMCAADCFQVLIHDPSAKVLALVHLGRAGIGKKLVQKVIGLMTMKFHCAPQHLLVTIGAGIRKDSYDYDRIPDSDPAWEPYLEKLSNGHFTIDMTSYLLKQLDDAGILEKNIFDEGIDTAKDPNYFSHHRSVKTGESEGRFAMVALQRP